MNQENENMPKFEGLAPLGTLGRPTGREKRKVEM